MLEKAATIKKIEYSPLDNELKKQTDIAKNQYKLLKDQKNNAIDNNREHGVLKDNVYYRYIGDEYKFKRMD